MYRLLCGSGERWDKLICCPLVLRPSPPASPLVLTKTTLGCLQSEQTVVYASERKLIFSSKMALYLLNPRTFAIEKIVSTQTRGTTSMSVSPHNDNLVACSGVDGSLCIWDLANESCERRLTHPADILAWDPHDPSNCAIIVNSPKIQLFSWCVYWLSQGSTWHVIGIFVRLFAPRNGYLLLTQILSSLMLQGC